MPDPVEVANRTRPFSDDGFARENAEIAAKLRAYADLLEQQGSDGFRTRAYRRAADVVAALDRPISEILAREGRDGLIALPGIGRGIAAAIAELSATGRWSQLERLRGELDPEALFRSIPGIGQHFAHLLTEEAHLENLEDLENALHSGQLDIRGIGPRRREMLSASLAERLGRVRRTQTIPESELPPVPLILQVDRMYRDKAAAGELRTIAPKRFNPEGKAWLPILHARHDKWHFTALFSNTRLAHELGRTDDWVVIYFQSDDGPEGRCTVVTETKGPMSGQRVVRGRENELQQKEKSHEKT